MIFCKLEVKHSHVVQLEKAQTAIELHILTHHADALDYDIRKKKPLEVGSVVSDDMIHYTMVKTTTFNGVKHPSIGILHEDGRFEVVREFGYEDFKNRLS